MTGNPPQPLRRPTGYPHLTPDTPAERSVRLRDVLAWALILAAAAALLTVLGTLWYAGSGH